MYRIVYTLSRWEVYAPRAHQPFAVYETLFDAIDSIKSLPHGEEVKIIF